MRRAILICGISLVALLGAKPATAHDDYDTFSGLPGLYGYGFSGNLYGLGRIPVPPYFSLHPPVYYSEPVARPYGLSPFAHRSAPLEVHQAKPTMITNPFVHQAPEAKSTTRKEEEDRVTSRAEVIVNPFVDSGWQVAKE